MISYEILFYSGLAISIVIVVGCFTVILSRQIQEAINLLQEILNREDQ